MQAPFVMVHLKVAVPPTGTLVTVEFGEDGVVIVTVPLTTDHTPVPGEGEFPARVKPPLLQLAWSGPAFAITGCDTLTVTFDDPEHPLDAEPVTL